MYKVCTNFNILIPIKINVQKIINVSCILSLIIIIISLIVVNTFPKIKWPNWSSKGVIWYWGPRENVVVDGNIWRQLNFIKRFNIKMYEILNKTLFLQHSPKRVNLRKNNVGVYISQQFDMKEETVLNRYMEILTQILIIIYYIYD